MNYGDDDGSAGDDEKNVTVANSGNGEVHDVCEENFVGDFKQALEEHQ